MLTFRRSLIAAIFIIICFFFLSRSKPSPTTDKSTTIDTVESPSFDNIDDTKAPSNQQPLQINQKQEEEQQGPDNIPLRPLRERLRDHYPYNVESKFPSYIWQTWKYTPASGWFAPILRIYEAAWTEEHPGFVHEVVDDDTAVYLFRYLYSAFPEIIEAYESMPMPVLKADFFRYLILLARGGIYSDIDTRPLKKVTEWLPEAIDRSTIGLVVGIEADPDRPDWAEWYSRRIQFCQWTIQSKPGHPILRDVVATITEQTLRMKRAGLLTKSKMDLSIVEFTGPAVWTDAIFSYFNNPMYFDMGEGTGAKNVTALDFTKIKDRKKLGDVVVLPITSFSPGVQQMGAESIEDPMAFVKHEFEGMIYVKLKSDCQNLLWSLSLS